MRSQAGMLGPAGAALLGGQLPSSSSVDLGHPPGLALSPVTCPVLGDMSDLKGVFLPQGS